MLSIHGLHSFDLPIEGCVERSGPCLRNQRFRNNVHRRIHDIGQESRPLVKDRTVIEFAVLFKHRNVIQMPVIVQYKRIDFKKQGQILWELP